MSTVPQQDREAGAAVARAALGVAGGAILSGPIGLAFAAAVPQPAWKDAETFAASFHPLQQAPFWFGFVLLSACVAFVARAAARAGAPHRARANAALISTGAFAAMIGVNYALQVAYVPHAARTHDPAVAYFAFANPGSIAWALEMFGYAAFGVATWLVAPLFRDGPRGRAIGALLVANGVVSIFGAVATAVDLTWVQTGPGIACFAGWNVLLVVTMGLVAFAYRPRPRPDRPSSRPGRPRVTA